MIFGWNQSWDAPFPYEAFLRQCITKALELEQVTLPCEINVLITDNEGIHRINLEQRQVDAAPRTCSPSPCST